MMIGYDIYDCFTMEHFRLRQRMTVLPATVFYIQCLFFNAGHRDLHTKKFRVC
jgi:hypothetical protein